MKAVLAKSLFRLGLLALLAILGAEVILRLQQETSRLSQQLAILRRRHEKVLQLRADNARTQEIIVDEAQKDSTARQLIRAEVEKLRREIAEREAAAEERREKNHAIAATVEANRDPTIGLVRMENFRNVGGGTPSAALQTLIWAAMKGDDQLLASMLTFDESARAKAQALLAGLPDAVRQNYSSPEQLASVGFADLITGHDAARFSDMKTWDSQHATIALSFDQTAAGYPLTMQAGQNGWQLMITDTMMPEFERFIRGIPAGQR